MGIIADMYKSQGRVGRARLVEHYDESGVYYVKETVYAKPPARVTKAPRRQTKAQARSGRRSRARHSRHSTGSRAAASGDSDSGGGDSDPLPPPRRVLRLAQVVEITGLKRPTIYKLIASGHFPRQVKLGSTAAGWISTEIEAWLDQQIAARDDGVRS